MFEPQCTKAQFVLTWDGKSRDRIYPALVNLKNGGRLLFLQNLQTVVAGQLSAIHLLSPKDGIAQFGGTKSTATLVIPESTFALDGRGWAYFGPDKFAKTEAADILVDDGIPENLFQLLSIDTPRLLQFYASGLGVPVGRKPTFYLHWNNRDDARESNQADVVPGSVIRFGISGKNWAVADAKRNARFQGVLAHELAHFWDGGVFKVKQSEIPWLHEGNAELLSNAALLALKLTDEATVAGQLSNAMSDCMSSAGSNAWTTLRGRDSGRVPYACGLVIQFALLANAQKHHSDVGATEFWRRYWKANPAYDENSLRVFFASLVDASAAETFGQLLDASNIPLNTTLRALLQSADIKLFPAEEATLSKPTFTALMLFDCSGSIGFWTHQDHFLTDNVPSCKTFKAGQKIYAVEEHDLFLAPAAAAQAAKLACNAGRALKYKSRDGAEFEMPCAPEAVQSLLTEPLRTQFDAAQVAAILLAR